MSKISEMNRKIEETLASIDGIGKAEPAPFFYTRLLARMERKEKNIWERVGRTVTRPAFATLSLGLVILVNAFVVLKGTPYHSVTPEGTDISMVDEYNRSTAANFYDIDNVQP